MAIKVNGQILIYPMRATTISGGFKNMAYYNHYKYTHIGIDCVELTAKSFEPISSGKGVVLGVEFNNHNGLGGIAVIRYNNVYCPKLKKTQDLIIRYFHMSKLYVKKGDVVKAYQPIGYVTYGHQWWNHIHIEIDSDIIHPFHTIQVKEESSQLLIRSGATDSTCINPKDVLCIGNNQTVVVHPNATLADSNDAPIYKESDFIISNTGGVSTIENSTTNNNININYQKLILPINNMRVTAGYKNPKYENLIVNGLRMGTHFGLDCGGSTTIYGSGNGTVLQAGYDSVLGNVVIVKYEKCYNHKLNKIVNVVFRYHHLASIAVAVGAFINSNTKIGVMGNTGKYSTATHLHIEADTDTAHYNFTPTLSGNTNTLKAGYRDSRDTTFNPIEVLYCKTSAPDNQSITRTYDGYTNDDDIAVVKII